MSRMWMIACWRYNHNFCFFVVVCRLVKSSDVENTKITLQALENKMAVMLRFLGHEDDDVSGAVAQFAHDYISILKQMQPVSHSQRKHVEV